MDGGIEGLNVKIDFEIGRDIWDQDIDSLTKLPTILSCLCVSFLFNNRVWFKGSKKRETTEKRAITLISLFYRLCPKT